MTLPLVGSGEVGPVSFSSAVEGVLSAMGEQTRKFSAPSAGSCFLGKLMKACAVLQFPKQAFRNQVQGLFAFKLQTIPNLLSFDNFSQLKQYLRKKTSTLSSTL